MTNAEGEKLAREWASSLGYKVTGVSCRDSGHSCDLNSEGTLYQLDCNSQGCRLHRFEIQQDRSGGLAIGVDPYTGEVKPVLVP